MTDIMNNANGSVQISSDALTKIVSLALAEVEGLSHAKNQRRSIKIQTNEAEVSISVAVSVKYGYRIPDICDAIRSSITSAIVNTTGLTVSTIDISIETIDVKNTVSSDKKNS